MKGKLNRGVALLFCLAAAGCGSLLDWRDSARGVIGPNTPTGAWKRDFWGNSYFEPYCWKRTPPMNETSDAVPQPYADEQQVGKSPLLWSAPFGKPALG
jgi:hypothetical protein